MGDVVAEPAVETGLEALTRFARRAAGADFALSFQAGADGLAVPLASDPGPLPRAFSLARTRLEGLDWSAGPRDAAPLCLPSAVLLAIESPVQQAMFISTPFPGSPRSGVILLWAAKPAWRGDCVFRNDMEGSVMLLRAAFGQMLADQHDRLSRALTADRFHDLFETVPTGIVVLDGDARTALVNARAAALLGMPSGEVEARHVGAQMRAMRERSINRAVLEKVYSNLQADLDHASTAIWVSADSHLEVDTHPILGHGRNGRIWLFHDVTARERLDDDLRRRAETDALTGLANRWRFFELGAVAFQRATASDTADGRVAVLLLDIDHFKRVNDGYGHPVGDAVLRDFAQRCQSVLRARDLLARMGGEEFAVLLPGMSIEEATCIAERLRAAVADASILTEGGRVLITVSIGGTSRRDGELAIDALLKRADIALYEAKGRGRNQVVFDGG